MVELFTRILLSCLIVMDPLGIVPLFISVAGDMPESRKRETIRKAILISFVVLCLFILLGRYILGFLGIQPGSFSVAGGILFFLIAIEMLFGQPRRSRSTGEEGFDDDHLSVAVFPLAIPMIAGPGMVTTIMLYSTGNHSLPLISVMLLVAVTIALVAVYLALLSAGAILKVLGKTGVSVVERIMGLLLAGLAVQFIYDGLVKLGLI